MEDAEWVKSLKIGDEVFIDYSKYDRIDYKRAKVERLTKLYVIVNKFKFRKTTGWRAPHDPWDIVKLVQITDKRIKDNRINDLQDQALILRNHLPIPQTEEELIRFIEALKPFVKKEMEAKE